MNKQEVIISVSEKSGVNVEDCRKVLDAFEEVFSNEVTQDNWKGSTFRNIYKIMTWINNRKN